MERVEPLKELQSILSGYLFKRSNGVFKTWNKRWFQISDDGQLSYSEKKEDPFLCIIEPDLRFVTVRYGGCEKSFELVNPEGKALLLKAETKEQGQEWIAAFQQTSSALYVDVSPRRRASYTASGRLIKPRTRNLSLPSEAALPGNQQSSAAVTPTLAINPAALEIAPPTPPASKNDIGDPPTLKPDQTTTPTDPLPPTFNRPIPKMDGATEKKYLNFINLNGNNECADCGSKYPEWVSLTIGILVCKECSGAHRSFSCNVSRIKSINLDYLKDSQWDMILKFGNDKINSIFAPNFLPKLNENCSSKERVERVKEKYIEKKFAMKMKEAEKENVSFAWTSTVAFQNRLLNENCFPLPNDLVEDKLSSKKYKWEQASSPTDLENIALKAIKFNDIGQMLNAIIQGLDVNLKIYGSPLVHLAVNKNLAGMLEFLLQNGALPFAKDSKGNTALHIASQKKFLPVPYRLLLSSTLADFERKNYLGQTALDVAKSAENTPVVVMLYMFMLKEVVEDSDAEEQFTNFYNEYKNKSAANKNFSI